MSAHIHRLPPSALIAAMEPDAPEHVILVERNYFCGITSTLGVGMVDGDTVCISRHLVPDDSEQGDDEIHDRIFLPIATEIERAATEKALRVALDLVRKAS